MASDGIKKRNTVHEVLFSIDHFESSIFIRLFTSSNKI